MTPHASNARALAIGDLVWLVGAFEDLWRPCIVTTAPWTESGGQTFVRVIPYGYDPKRSPDHIERMNVIYVSKTHPRGWRFIDPGEESQGR